MSAVVLFSAVTWLAITMLSRGFWGGEGFFYDLPNERMPFGRFFILYTIAFALYLFIITKVSTFSTSKRNICIVLGGAFVFRLILIPSVPVHENDIYRYIWDGKVFTAGINPYRYPPLSASIKPASVDQQDDFEKLKSLGAKQESDFEKLKSLGVKQESDFEKLKSLGVKQESDFEKLKSLGVKQGSDFEKLKSLGVKQKSDFEKLKSLGVKQESDFEKLKSLGVKQESDFEKLKSLRDEDSKFYRRISYKDVPTIYPPLNQVFFAVSTLFAPGSIWFMKLLFVLFDMAVIILLYMVLKLLDQNPLYVIIYAWNPLVLKEFANSGHNDALVICCVMAGVYLVLKEKYTLSSACLGLGVLSKFYPLIFIPFFLLKNKYKASFTCLAVIAAGYLPFFVWGQADHISVFTGLGTYVREWSINGFIFELIHSLLSIFDGDPNIISKTICGSIFTLTWIFIFNKKQSVIEKTFLAVTALFLLSPVGDPWYFSWVIPFLCIYRKYSLISLSYLLILSYFQFTRDFGVLDLGGFKIDNLLLIQYVPFYSILLFESRLNRYNQQHGYLMNKRE